MAEYIETSPKPLSEEESKTKYTIKSSVSHKKFHQKEELKGGKGDNRPDSDFDSKQLKAGTEIEFEHTHDRDKAKEIAKDHLTESEDYYRELKKMEAKIKKSFTRADSLIKAMKDAIDEDEMDLKKKFKSKKQQKYMYAAAERGEIPKDVVEEFSDKTKDFKKLPEDKDDTKKSGPGDIISKALRAADILGLSRRQRLDLMYRAGAVAAGNNKDATPFHAETVEVPEDLGIDKSHLRPDFEPPAVPIRRVETPMHIPAKPCKDHTYEKRTSGPQEAVPFWRR